MAVPLVQAVHVAARLKLKLKMLIGISIVVPVAKDDETWKNLLLQFNGHKEIFEIIFIGPEFKNAVDGKFRYIHCDKNRAGKMNAGALLATYGNLFFLHADSEVSQNCLNEIITSLNKNPISINHFELSFSDGSPAMKLNEAGANLRSKFLKMPFGDQGFFMTKKTFFALGCYPENSAYGEDHLLIWKAHLNNITVIANKNPIYTSARKYQKDGWLKTTLKHIFLTYQQAIPEMLKAIKGSESKIAVAIFVKTPGVSPVKTRLAQSIGKESAEHFFNLSLKATEEIVITANKRLNGSLAIYWAVSEPDCHNHSLWSNFSVIGQGTGQLGDRLHYVYSNLISKHRKVILIGADLPHLDSNVLAEAAQLSDKHIIGKTDDGGFYLYSGTTQIDEQVWTSVKYSCGTTADELIQKIGIDKFGFLKQNFDIDVLDDLKKLGDCNPEDDVYLPTQKSVINWARNL